MTEQPLPNHEQRSGHKPLEERWMAFFSAQCFENARLLNRNQLQQPRARVPWPIPGTRRRAL
eukprot:1060908-Lingulodinium_polyedra.AAC.1